MAFLLFCGFHHTEKSTDFWGGVQRWKLETVTGIDFLLCKRVIYRSHRLHRAQSKHINWNFLHFLFASIPYKNNKKAPWVWSMWYSGSTCQQWACCSSWTILQMWRRMRKNPCEIKSLLPRRAKGQQWSCSAKKKKNTKISLMSWSKCCGDMELLRSDDEVVYGDSGHIGTEKHPKIKENEHLASIDYCIVRRPRSLPRVSDSAIDWGRLIDHRKASISSLQRSIFIFATINLFSTTAIRPRIASPINQLSSFRLPLHFAVRTYVLFIVHQHQHFCKK